MESLNLCDYPWIPIAGKKERKSLMQIFSEPDLSQLSGNPVDKIVILRFLLCIVHASSPIPDNAAWQDLTTAKMAENAKKYLQEHHDCFDLYGEKPFLQFPKLAEIGGEAKPLSELIIGFSNNSVTATGWNVIRDFEPADLIIALIRSSCYILGKNGYNPRLVLTKGIRKSVVGKPGSLLGPHGYLHCFMQGKLLWDTLKLNLLTEENIQGIGIRELGVPFWEDMPQGEFDDRAREYRKSYLGTLFPLDKFMLLQPNGVIITDGIPYNDDAEKNSLSMQCMNDPALIHLAKGKILCASTSKAPWRELPAILAYSAGPDISKDPTHHPYFLYYGCPRVSTPVTKFWCGGLEVSYESGGNAIKMKNSFVESSFRVHTRIADMYYKEYCALMKELEGHGNLLKAAVKNYWLKLWPEDKSSSKKIRSKRKSIAEERSEKAVAVFWELMASHADFILNLAFAENGTKQKEHEEKIQKEKRSWFRILCQIFNDLCPHETPRQMEAWVNTNPEFQN